MNQKKIAIFGSSGHIGKNLVTFFIKNNNFKTSLFSRDLNSFKPLKFSSSGNISLNTYNNFKKNEYDVIVNCIGTSAPKELKKTQSSIFNVTEFYDNMILEYLKIFPTTLYINLSSGAVFGRTFEKPVDNFSTSKLEINDINKDNSYSISKIYSESKHRYLSDLNIIDLRIFGFFSRFIDVSARFFMSELLQSLKNKSEFVTTNEDIIRDYVDPSDFYNLIKNCISNKKTNNVFDVYSKKPVSKFNILEEFSKTFDFKFKLVEKLESLSPTGLKKNYYSLSRKAEKIGYFPQFSSLETILNESSQIFENN
jgi:nucleoside-diphosphate-sugar epimerase